MRAREDTGKALQDFLSPELRAICIRLDALEKRAGFVDRTSDNIGWPAENRNDVMSAMPQGIDLATIQQRLARLESKEAAHQ